MPNKVCQWKNTPCRFTNGDFFQILWLTMGFLPGGVYVPISCYLMPDFTPSMARFVPNDIIFDEVCRVFVLRRQSTSHLTCPVLFRQGHLLYTVLQPQCYTSHTFVHSYIHAFMYSYIHTFIHSCIHTFMQTQHVRNIIHT